MKASELLSQKKEHLLDIYLLVSEEPYLIRQLLTRVEKKLISASDENLTKIKLEEESEDFWGELERAVTTLNMFSASKLVIVKCRDLFKKKTSSDKKLIELIKNSAQGIGVYFTSSGVDGRLKTVKTIKKQGNLIQMSAPDRRKIDKWIRNQFAQYNIKVDQELVDALKGLFQNRLDALSQEISKIATLNYGSEWVNLKDCQGILSREGILEDNFIFTLIDRWAEGDVKGCLQIYRQLIREGKSSMYVIAMIHRQLKLLVAVKEMKQEISSPDEIARRLGEHPYSIKKCLSQEKRFSRDELIESLDKLRRANRRIVTGKYFEEGGPVEDFLLDIEI